LLSSLTLITIFYLPPFFTNHSMLIFPLYYYYYHYFCTTLYLVVDVAVLQFVGPSTLVQTLTSNNLVMLFFIIFNVLLTTIPVHTPTSWYNTYCFSGDLGTFLLGNPIILQPKCQKGCLKLDISTALKSFFFRQKVHVLIIPFG